MRLLLLLIPLVGACAPYVQTHIELSEQAQRGLVMLSEHHGQRGAMIEQLHELRRLRLDEAFDADVRQRDPLDAEWVIEHRRAYAAAVEVLTRSAVASAEAERTARENVEAIREALERLRAMQSRLLRIGGGQ